MEKKRNYELKKLHVSVVGEGLKLNLKSVIFEQSIFLNNQIFKLMNFYQLEPTSVICCNKVAPEDGVTLDLSCFSSFASLHGLHSQPELQWNLTVILLHVLLEPVQLVGVCQNLLKIPIGQNVDFITT